MTGRAFSTDEFFLKTALTQWMLLHPGPRKSSAEGWYYAWEDEDEVGGPFFTIFVRHDDGREFDFQVGMYTRVTDGCPFNVTFDWNVVRELHERYPNEVDPPADNPYFHYSDQWEPKIFVDVAVDAAVKGDIDAFVQAVSAAARAMSQKKRLVVPRENTTLAVFAPFVGDTIAINPSWADDPDDDDEYDDE